MRNQPSRLAHLKKNDGKKLEKRRSLQEARVFFAEFAARSNKKERLDLR